MGRLLGLRGSHSTLGADPGPARLGDSKSGPRLPHQGTGHLPPVQPTEQCYLAISILQTSVSPPEKRTPAWCPGAAVTSDHIQAGPKASGTYLLHSSGGQEANAKVLLQDRAPCAGSGGESPCPSSSGRPWAVAAASSLCLPLHTASSASPCISPSCLLQGHSLLGLGPTLIQGGLFPTLTSVTAPQSLPSKSPRCGGKTWTGAPCLPFTSDFCWAFPMLRHA